MTTIRFGIVHFFVDLAFTVLMFFAFMCGVHYGTQFIGLYYWFIKFLLGIVAMGLTIACTQWIQKSILFVLKCGSIYVLCRDDCNTVLGSFSGIASHLKSTVSITVFNKLIRECLDSVSEKVLAASADSPLTDLLESLNNSPIARASEKIVVKAFDYADECVLGYCFKNVSEEKGIFRCAIEGFVLFVRNAPQILGKVLTIITIQSIAKVGYWIVFVLYCWNNVYFSIHAIPMSLMNLVVCYCVGKLILFLINDAFFEPALMHGVILTFCKYSWEDEMDEMEEKLMGSVPALGRLKQYSEGKKTKESTVANEDGGESEMEESAQESNATEPSAEEGNVEFRL